MNIIVDGFQMLFQVLNQWIGDYGIAIVAFTICIKFIMLPLNIKQRNSMKKQSIMNDKIKELKEKYKNNDKKLKEEMNALIMKQGSVMTGCLLSFIQLPIMYGLYQVIRNGLIDGTTVLLPWIESLVLRDPYFILPLLSIVVQSIPYLYPHIRQFKQLNLPKTNKGMYLIMVFVTGTIGISLPSGISLYYLVSSMFSMMDQLFCHVLQWRKMQKAATIS